MIVINSLNDQFWDKLNIFLLTLVGHLAFGVVIGLLVSRFVKDRESFIKILRNYNKKGYCNKERTILLTFLHYF